MNDTFFRLSSKLLGAITAMALSLTSAVAFAAAPDVVTVPWRGVLDLQHETYDGKQIHLKGVAHGVVAGATASWDPGDGSGAIAVGPNPVAGFDFDLGVVHTYPNSAPGTPFTATLTVCNNGGGAGTECASDTYRVVVRARTLDVEINIGIDEGLWYTHRTQTRNGVSTDGAWFSQGDVSPTASSVQAFQINNHFETDPATDDPYADTVARGLKWLFARMRSVGIGVQPAGDPDANGNGLGVEVPFGSRPIYEGGQVMDAIVSSRTPGTLTTTGPNGAALLANIGGRTYGDIVQDMVDMYAWGQYDSAANRGGWRYAWNQGPDNSAAQWAAIGILAARDLFGSAVPAFVYSENLVWLGFSQNPSLPAAATGYGYTTRGEGVALSPSGLVQLVMDGVPKTDVTRWVGVEDRLASLWNSWYRDTSNYYGLFALAKAMRLALPNPTVIMSAGTANAIDWFNADCANPAACNSATDKWGVARTILRDQNSNGQFTGAFWTSGPLHHAWGVIILTGTLRLQPVAVASANPNPGADGLPIAFDGSASFHQDPARTLVLYEWDFDNDGAPDATGMTASNSFNCPTLPTPCIFPVTLTVTDDGTPTPLIDSTTINIEISNPPHPPTSDPDGPYLACVNEQMTLDGSGSFDVDEGMSLSGNPPFDRIRFWDWELDFAQPLDFADASGVAPSHAFGSAGGKDIGLRVTDNSAAAFGAQVDLTNDAFTSARITTCDCIGAISVRPKSGKNQLVWAPVGGAASYDIYRSTSGPWSGYGKLADDHVTTYATYLDSGLTNGVTYWYRVMPNDGQGAEMCGSDDASGTPQARTRRR